MQRKSRQHGDPNKKPSQGQQPAHDQSSQAPEEHEPPRRPAELALGTREHPPLGSREQAVSNRETWVSAREEATGRHEAIVVGREEEVARREELLRLREESLRAHAEAAEATAERDRLLAQMRDANERLVLATLRSDELAEEAVASRAKAVESAALEAEGRRRAEALAEQLRASEGALRASEAQFRTLANTIPMLAWYASPDGDVAWYNDRWYEYTGTTLEEQAGWKWQSVHDPDDLPRVMERWRAALRSGEPWEDVFRLRRRDGVMRWFLSRALPLRDETGRIVRWFGTNIDIDDQKRDQERAWASDRAKDEFLAMLGHELRNPLSAITLTLDLMAVRDSTAFAHERTVLQTQVKHLVHLVDDLLDVSRIAKGKIELQRESIELADVVSRAVEMARPLVDEKAHHLTIDVARHGLVVDADPTRLAQAIGNLLTNAAKYTRPHGTITVTGRRHGSRVSLHVRDSGIGISPEILPRVFDLFVQERQALDRSLGGLGLGLPIVQRLVTLHGGTVTAASEGHGRGSEFVIELPASQHAVEPHAMGSVGAGPAPLGLKVLVVDDNRLAAEALGMLLPVFGCEVRVAFDAPSALAVAKDFTPDVALLDIGLPQIDGYELAKRLRTLCAPHQIRFVALTGYGQADDVRRSMDAGFEFHLVKPVGAVEIEQTLRSMAQTR